MRNRIIWHFEHGLHCSRRFSGRYETILWFTKTDDYTFNLDPVRVPQKYPGKKYFKGPKAGQYSCNPLGKNPGDMWVIPNVKSNHVEKTDRPCQFPVELIERLVLSMTSKDGQKTEVEAAGETPIFSYSQTDFVKDRVAVEVQFGKYAFVAYDLFVKPLPF